MIVVLVLVLGAGGCGTPEEVLPTAPVGTTSAAPTPSPSGPADPPRSSPKTTSHPFPTSPPQPPPRPSPPEPTTVAPAPPEPTEGPELPAEWRGVDLERIPTDRRVVALTFDGGASDAGVARILAVLARSDVPATFFVTGAFARTYPEQVRAIADAGHPVGHHSDTHRSYPDLTDVEIRADLATAETEITSLTGRPARPLFRFPYGARTDADIRVVNDAGYLPVRWTVDSLGWKGTSGGLSVAAVTDRVLTTAVPGQIVLMHVGANPEDGTTLDADALPDVIAGLRGRGYGFVGLDALVD
ncbi:polysaccharide deacetylase family protein [Georgenia satyanarayanai]|uniref:polysaccharide deacetylase family protein n=1 Tax=Georgenia satyanarayanai TaxID=860221 RepID=UPI001D01349E|nr:polysaccharide deacetylase family protein [Georgenia satyanarayanai]